MQAITIRRPAAIASALLLAATLAIAGTSHADGPRRGPAGGPAGGGLVEHVIAGLKDRLALDSSQQLMFDQARAQTLAARDQAVAQRKDVRARIDAELAKNDPDLAAVAMMVEGVSEQGLASRRAARDQWLKLYANLRPDQKVVVRDAIRERIAHGDEMRDQMRQRSQRAPS
ncbi:MAG TPA: hypothetical protein VII68_10515 [Casimicrobiaceae bacterium]